MARAPGESQESRAYRAKGAREGEASGAREQERAMPGSERGRSKGSLKESKKAESHQVGDESGNCRLGQGREPRAKGVESKGSKSQKAESHEVGAKYTSPEWLLYFAAASAKAGRN